MIKIKQFRYGGATGQGASFNYPQNINYQSLLSGSAFAGYAHIKQLGIQAPPGSTFFVNGSGSPIIIGDSGVFELTLNGDLEISSIAFSAETLTRVEKSGSGYLIIDIMYEGG